MTRIDEPGSRAWTLDVLATWVARGWLRPLDGALATFVADLSPSANGPVLLAVALTAHLEGRGHTCLAIDDLVGGDLPDLSWSDDATDALHFVLRTMPTDAAAWLAALDACNVIQRMPDDRAAVPGRQPLVVDHGRLYLRRYWRHESRIACAIVERAAVDLEVDETSVRSWIDRLFEDPARAGVDWQRVACALALRSRVAVITGGPGTGKTYTAARLLALSLATRPPEPPLRIALAAPTGRAAARLRQSIDLAFEGLRSRVGDSLASTAVIGPARTLHSLLGVRRGTRRFRHDASNPLDLDLLIVDEASMIHVEMMDALLAALPSRSRLVLVGDRDQLASVEAGSVLGELSSEHAGVAGGYDDETVRYVEATTGQRVAVSDVRVTRVDRRIVRLRHSERFGGALDLLAQAVNTGRPADAASIASGSDKGISWNRAAFPIDVVDAAVAGYAAWRAALAARPDTLFVEEHEGWTAAVLEAFGRFRVLSATRDGDWGVAGLNAAIQRRLGLPTQPWFIGRPVIAMRNDPDLGVFNGDVGVVLPAGPGDDRLRAWFSDGAGLRSIGVSRLTDVDTAFAMTVHRAQGSEFDAVALVLPPGAERVVTRELLYTGITRARTSLTILSADAAALPRAVERRTRRGSGLAAMIAALDR